MRVRRITARRIAPAVVLALGVMAVGCGTRGAPLPPIYPNPPAITGLTVAQRGSFAILRFPPPEVFTRVGSEDVEIEAVELLVYAERYPVITAQMLAAAIDRRVEVMAVDSVAEAAADQARAAQLAAREAALAAGLPPPAPDPDGPPTAVVPRRPDEDLIYRMPPAILAQWESQGLAADAVLQAAQRLVNSVNVVWQQLGLPLTMIDPDEPLLVPDAGTIARASQALVARTDYERPLGLPVFLARASVSRSVPVEQFAELTVDDMLQVALPMSTPSTSPLQTRYFFAVRARSTQNTPGVVSALVALAPAPVPVAPETVRTTVGANGVELTWSVPAGDLALRRLDPAAIVYNVYRLDPDGIAGPRPLNATPLTTNSYTDTTMNWGETYVYEVRPLLAVAASPTARREGEGTRTAELQVVDTYPPSPAANVIINRAGGRVALQWTASPSIDIVGYRVYRHVVPAPEVPLRFNPTAPEDDPASTAPPASGPPPGADATEGAAVDNDLIAAGWELITPTPVPFSRATDPDADTSVRYVYAVEAIDAAGNLSALAIGTEPGDFDR